MLYLKCGDKMKKILKFIGILIGVVYASLAIVLTIFLLNYNRYNITEIDGKSLILIRDEELEPAYNKGSLVVVKRNPNKDIKVGDQIFFYDIYDGTVSINIGTITEIEEVSRKESVFTVEGDYDVPNDDVIGKAETSIVYENVGTYLSILESKYGFLILIIFPMLVFFIYEVYIFIEELKSSKDE